MQKKVILILKISGHDLNIVPVNHCLTMNIKRSSLSFEPSPKKPPFEASLLRIGVHIAIDCNIAANYASDFSRRKFAHRAI